VVAVVRRLVISACTFLIGLLIMVPLTGSPAAGDTTPRPPSSMAAIGDSMTRAADACCWYGDHPANSWSTGDAGWDGVLSHYERIRSLNSAITGHNHNDAVSGARMSDAPGQAQHAVDQRAGYVTIEMGANDLCTSSMSTMTSIDTFRTEFQDALRILDTGLPPRSRIFVASIPDIYQLWSLYHGDSTAELVWDVANICQSLLSPQRTDADRTQFRQQNEALNQVLAEECARLTRCRYDGGAVFGYTFTRSDVSKLDYFHPSLTGQAHLASITWAHSWWSTS
jgi:lysophospholipase L1-like esterase